MWILSLTLLMMTVASSYEWDFPPECSPTCPWAKNATADADPPTSAGNASGEWCEGVEFPEPPVQTQLPKCKNITVRHGIEFRLAPDGRLTITGVRWNETFDDFRLSEDNATASVCFPLSPQLLQCGLKRLDRRLYAYDAPLLALRNCRTNEATSIRDYFTSGGTGEAIGCSEAIGMDLGQRCQYLDYHASEYELSAANASIRLLPTGSVINQPDYRPVHQTHIQVCVPLSPEFSRCKERIVLQKHDYSVGPDRRVYIAHSQEYVGLGDYLFVGDKVLYCPPPQKSHRNFYFVIAILLLVNTVFLFLAVVVHLLVPSLNYHVKPLLCHMSSMAVMYVCVSIRYQAGQIPPAACYGLFVVMYYSGLTSYFWLNVLAFDLWSIFANLTLGSRLGCAAGWSARRKFACYALYAFGVPLLLVAACLVLDSQPLLQEAVNLRPQLVLICWFNERKSMLVLYFGPLFALLVVNFVLYGWTIANMLRTTKEVKIVNKKRNKQLLFVCLKIFVIMGLFSTIQLTTFIVNAKGGGQYASDISNAIQGILLFIIYICKPATYQMLRKKYFPSSSTARETAGPKNSGSSGISMESVFADEEPTKEEGSPHARAKKTGSDQQAEDTV